MSADRAALLAALDWAQQTAEHIKRQDEEIDRLRSLNGDSQRQLLRLKKLEDYNTELAAKLNKIQNVANNSEPEQGPMEPQAPMAGWTPSPEDCATADRALADSIRKQRDLRRSMNAAQVMINELKKENRLLSLRLSDYEQASTVPPAERLAHPATFTGQLDPSCHSQQPTP